MERHPTQLEDRPPEKASNHTSEPYSPEADWFRYLRDHSQDLLCTHDLEGRLQYVNHRAARLLGYSVEEMLGVPLWKFLPAHHRTGFEAYLKDIERRGEASGLMTFVTHAGEARIWEYHNRLETEARPFPIVFGMAHDVTERVHAESALRASEELFKNVFRDAPVGMVLAAPDGRFLEVNQFFSDFLGYSADELLAKTIQDVTYPDDLESSAQAIKQAFTGPGVKHFEKRYLHKNGRTKWGEVSTSTIKSSRGKPYVVGQIVDVTQRKQAEKAQRIGLERAQLLWKIGHLVSSRAPLTDLAHAAVEEMTQHLGCDVALLFEKQGEELPLLAIGAATAKFKPDAVLTHCLGQCLCGLAARDAMPIYCLDIHKDPRCTWEECRKAGLRSFAALPLKDEERVIGVLGLGSAATHDFQNAAAFLETLAIEISGGLVNSLLHRRLAEQVVQLEQEVNERKRVEAAITTLVSEVKGDTSESFFSSMACSLAKCLSADHTIIAELLEGQEDAVKTLAVCGGGKIVSNFVYELANTPCAGVVNRGFCSYTSGVAELFPKDVLLSEMKAEGYVGTPLFGLQGQVVGIMVALYSRPLPNPEFAEMIVRLFSARTAAEVERQHAEAALRRSEERFRVALRDSPVIVSNQDRDLRYTWAYNPRLAWANQNLIGKTDLEVVGGEAGSRLMAIKKEVLASGLGARVEFALPFEDEEHYLDLTIEPVAETDGSVAGLTCAATDVTHLREINEELQRAREKLTEEKYYLEQEIDAELGFGEIIGDSKVLKEVKRQASWVASSDATVLVLGETGVGKELIARALHHLSKREHGPFIKMNCAAVPSGLLESELFGHEKGAFTGAVAKKIGRLELADQGTLFLDEIGEIPLELQPKLLRVLQDQEFERLGATKTLKVTFRLIAATNRDLFREVHEKRFRSDLFYRLNVFPIRIPPLRERRSDIPLLVEHFTRKHAQRMKKSITSIPKTTMDILVRWHWPGNVRELDNFLERSVILTNGSVLTAPIAELHYTASPADDSVQQSSLKLLEREHIVRILKESRGHLSGPSGAAARLGLPRTTLQSKLKQMGIDPRTYRLP